MSESSGEPTNLKAENISIAFPFAVISIAIISAHVNRKFPEIDARCLLTTEIFMRSEKCAAQRTTIFANCAQRPSSLLLIHDYLDRELNANWILNQIIPVRYVKLFLQIVLLQSNQFVCNQKSFKCLHFHIQIIWCPTKCEHLLRASHVPKEHSKMILIEISSRLLMHKL